ncbi:surf-like protein [Metarhizium acridum]|uniref:surf-like protein n=1 Tax=Metarhizium acridum TaxID=92637 RepID=UPI001C6BED3D|nr:surf-like protein [Metarhizium acridum]
MKFTQLMLATFATLALAAPRAPEEDFKTWEPTTVKEILRETQHKITCKEQNNMLRCESSRGSDRDELTPRCAVNGGCRECKVDPFRDFATHYVCEFVIPPGTKRPECSSA